LYQEDGLINYYKDSQYGAHHSTAIKIFYDFPLFGVGIKNFRHESIKEKYNNSDYKSSNARQATHPHQIHLEFLSETGIFGYFCFFIFILFSLIISFKNYYKSKNIFQLSSIVFVLSSLLPLLPSGSFLSTFNSGIFWINFAIMIGFCKISINKS
jgi:O-antigen ligase